MYVYQQQSGRQKPPPRSLKKDKWKKVIERGDDEEKGKNEWKKKKYEEECIIIIVIIKETGEKIEWMNGGSDIHNKKDVVLFCVGSWLWVKPTDLKMMMLIMVWWSIVLYTLTLRIRKKGLNG